MVMEEVVALLHQTQIRYLFLMIVMLMLVMLVILMLVMLVMKVFNVPSHCILRCDI